MTILKQRSDERASPSRIPRKQKKYSLSFQWQWQTYKYRIANFRIHQNAFESVENEVNESVLTDVKDTADHK